MRRSWIEQNPGSAALLAGLGLAGLVAWARSRGRGGGAGGGGAEGGAVIGGTALVSGLRSQAFPAQTRFPGALVHVPQGFNPAAPLDVFLYFRGLGSCVAAVSANTATRCRPNGALHHGSHLVDIVDAARVNVLLVVAELQVESGSTDPGRFARPGGVRDFLGELVERPEVRELVGGGELAALRSVFIGSHSGGWAAAAATIAHGDCPVRGCALFDSLYGGSSVFDGFALKVGRGELGPGGRFSSVYIGGAPETNSVALARSLRRRLPASAIRVDTSRNDLTASDFTSPPVYFRHFRTEHNLVPEKVLPWVLAGGGFDPLG